ncbi:hypothetical protein BD413DRAFT_294326 [Trametes elegans]|nr:hypothetical protein BD413DRAFT_294326 [Trametes elegans]
MMPMSEKVASMVRNAERNNDKLFPILHKNLSSDSLPEYTTAAEKLSVWLSKDKAYYKKARPNIIQLIETAHENVRRHSPFSTTRFHVSRCPDELRPWAEPYMKLVRTVAPFYLLFPEATLRSRLRVLLQTICDNVDEFLSKQKLVPRMVADNPLSFVAGTSQLPLSPPIPVSPAPTALAQKPPASSASFASGSGTAPPPSTVALHQPLLTHRPPAAIPLPATNTLETTGASPPAPTSIPESTMGAEKTRHKAKRRRLATMGADFIEADLNWYKGIHVTAPTVDPNPLESLLPAAQPASDAGSHVDPSQVQLPSAPEHVVEGATADVDSPVTMDVDQASPPTIAADTEEARPPEDVDMRESSGAAAAPLDTTNDQNDTDSPFTSTSARVLSIARGASAATPANRPVIMDFELTEEALAQVARWNRRDNDNTEYAALSSCLAVPLRSPLTGVPPPATPRMVSVSRLCPSPLRSASGPPPTSRRGCRTYPSAGAPRRGPKTG